MTKIFVTGGAGFIGSNFIRYWLKKYPTDHLINFDKLTYASNKNSLSDIAKNLHYRFVKGDITNKADVTAAIKGADIVVHFAAESHVDRSIRFPDTFVKTNVLGTQTLLDAALNNKVKRFHHVSTDEVFGSLDPKKNDKFSETTPYNPHSPYSASKAASDHFVRVYFDTFKLPITISNCSNNFGPFQHPEKLIPRFITNLLENKKVPVYGKGHQIRDWLHVFDHCRAIELILKKGTPGETYCVGGQTKLVDNLELTLMLLKLMGKTKSSIEHVPDRKGHDVKYAINWSKIKNKLGWHPEHDLNSWLADTIEWYRQNERWWKPLKKEAERMYSRKAP